MAHRMIKGRSLGVCLSFSLDLHTDYGNAVDGTKKILYGGGVKNEPDIAGKADEPELFGAKFRLTEENNGIISGSPRGNHRLHI